MSEKIYRLDLGIVLYVERVVCGKMDAKLSPVRELIVMMEDMSVFVFFARSCVRKCNLAHGPLAAVRIIMVQMREGHVMNSPSNQLT